VHPSAGLDILEKRKIACLCWDSNLGHPACSLITLHTTACQFWSVWLFSVNSICLRPFAILWCPTIQALFHVPQFKCLFSLIPGQ
jgi:hypothetical protein